MVRKTAAALGQEVRDQKQELEHLRKVYDGEKKKRDKVNTRAKKAEADLEEARKKLRSKTCSISLLRKEIYGLKQLEEQRNRIESACMHLENLFDIHESKSMDTIPRVLHVLHAMEDRLNNLESLVQIGEGVTSNG